MTAGRCAIVQRVLPMTKRIFKELVRRGVFRALGAYIAIVWMLAQGFADLFPAIGISERAVRIFLGVAIVATPLVILLAWRYDLTRKGLLRDRVDVALAEQRAAASAGQFGPTVESLLPEPGSQSIVEVIWEDETGRKREKHYGTAFVIGRGFGSDFIVRDDRVSRRHAYVYADGEDWYVEDLTSLNGTYVDGRAINREKIEPAIECSLHKDGPRIRLRKRSVDETRATIDLT